MNSLVKEFIDNKTQLTFRVRLGGIFEGKYVN